MLEKISLYFGLSTKKLVQLISIYSIAHLGVFANINSYFWDDYTLVGVNKDIVIQIFKENGTFLNIAGKLHVFLLGIGVWIYKVITFFSFLFSGLFLGKILKRRQYLDDDYIFFVVILFLVLPFFMGRQAIILLPYSICNFLFYLAWSLNQKNKLLSLFFFFLSYIIPSFIVFSILPFIELYYFKNRANLNIKSFFSFVSSHFYFAALPFVFFIFKLVYFKPYGNYIHYNENYSLINLALSPIRMFKDLILSFYPFVCVSLIFILVLFMLGYKFSFKLNIKYKLFILLSFVIILIGCFPYWILGLVPSFSEWSTRHQLLLPFGASMLITALVYLYFQKRRIIIFSFIIAVSIFFNIKNYVEFYLDWDKQEQLVQLFKNNEIIKNSNFLIMYDQTDNALDRKYRYYEWNGLFSKSFCDEKRFGVNADDDQLIDFISKQLFQNQPNFRAVDSLISFKQSRCSQFGNNEKIHQAFVEIKIKKKSTLFSTNYSFLPKFELSVSSR